jgi:hypothetical protein
MLLLCDVLDGRSVVRLTRLITHILHLAVGESCVSPYPNLGVLRPTLLKYQQIVR